MVQAFSFLLVEDNPAICGIIVPKLESHSHRVRIAETVQAAKEAMEAEKPDLLIIDELLLETHGASLIPKLRESGNRIKIVVLTALGADAHSSEGIRKWPDVSLVMRKPIEPAELVEQVHRVLGVGNAAAQPTLPAEALKKFQELRLLYRRELPKKTRNVAALSRQAFQSTVNWDRAAEARKAAHRLRGSAGIYGFDEVGDIVGRIEDYIAQRLDERTEDTSEFPFTLEAEFANLDKALGSAEADRE